MMENKGIEAIPCDLIIEILSRLPTNELSKCRCVCKQWYILLTSNKEFSAQHMKYSKTKPLLLFRKYSSNFFMEVKNNRVSVDLTAINMEGTVINKFRTVIEGPVHTFVSSGALSILCCMNSLYVISPSSKKVISLPCPSRADSFYTVGFGYLARSNEYKIIHLFKIPALGDGKMASEILTLKGTEGLAGDSWRPVGPCPRIVSASDCLCVDGSIFWEIQGKEIISFDLEKEEFKVHCYPIYDSAKYTIVGLTGLQGTLSLVGLSTETSTVDIWLMMDSGTWMMTCSVGLFCLGADNIVPSDNYSGDILLITKQKDLIKYNLTNQTSTKISYSGSIGPHRHKPCSYFDCLYSLDKPMQVSI